MWTEFLVWFSLSCGDRANQQLFCEITILIYLNFFSFQKSQSILGGREWLSSLKSFAARSLRPVIKISPFLFYMRNTESFHPLSAYDGGNTTRNCDCYDDALQKYESNGSLPLCIIDFSALVIGSLVRRYISTISIYKLFRLRTTNIYRPNKRKLQYTKEMTQMIFRGCRQRKWSRASSKDSCRSQMFAA